MNNEYDFTLENINAYTLTIAYYLTLNNKKVLLIKNKKPNNKLYSDDKWSEYSDDNINLLNLLKKMEFNLHDYFICLKNQNTFSKLYLPKLPLEDGLYKDWLNKIMNTGNCYIRENLIDKLDHTDELDHNKKNITIAFHWNTKYDLITCSNTLSIWNTKYIVLSDYMFFNDPNSLTVIQTVIEDPSLIPSSYYYDDVINSIVNELKHIFVNLPEPDSIVFNINKLNNIDQLTMEQQIIKGSTYINNLNLFKKIQLFRPDDIEGIFKFLFLMIFLYSLFNKVL